MNNELITAFKQLLQQELNPIKSQLEENTQILKSLEHKVDVIKAEQENMKHELASISGDTKATRTDIENIWKDLTFMIAAIYSRKSVFTGKGEFIENQVQMCKE